MILPAHIRMAIASLRSTRIRTALTTLGIVIGVTSITLVLSLGEGARQAITAQVAALDKEVILVQPGRQLQRSIFDAYNPFNLHTNSTITEQDFTAISRVPGQAAAAPMMVLSGSTRMNDTKVEASPLVATTPDLPEVLELKIRSGQFLDPTTSRSTVVLGSQLAVDLLGTDQARGQEILIRGRPFTVIGVLKRVSKPINVLGINLDHAAFMNLEAGKVFNQGVVQIHHIISKTNPEASVGEVAAGIDTTLLQSHAGERDFSVIEGSQADRSASPFYATIVSMTALVAGIALIVGGVGIMNVMLVSVTERTREIGIRKALGATDGQILLQFLIEALIMTTVGGLIGLSLAYGLAFAISSFFGFQPAVTWPIISLAMGLSGLVGIVFGLFPAMRASKKNPIAALRQYQ